MNKLKSKQFSDRRRKIYDSGHCPDCGKYRNGKRYYECECKQKL